MSADPSSETPPDHWSDELLLLSHHLLALLDPYRGRDRQEAALRWLSALTPAFLSALARDPAWSVVHAVFAAADDERLLREEAADHADAVWSEEQDDPGDGVGDSAPPSLPRPSAAGNDNRRASREPLPVALHAADLRELLVDDYHARPHVLPVGPRGRALLSGVDGGAAGGFEALTHTAAARPQLPWASVDFARALPWAVTNHATWVLPLAELWPEQPAVWRTYLQECVEQPVERAMPARLARAAGAICGSRPERQLLLARLTARLEHQIGRLPPLDVLPRSSHPGLILGLRAAAALLIREYEVTDPRLVALVELAGITRLLRHASAHDVRAAWRDGGRSADGALDVLRRRTHTADLVFEHVLVALLQQPSSEELATFLDPAGREAVRFSTRAYDRLRLVGQPHGILPAREDES